MTGEPNLKNPLVKIELTEEDALLFRRFRQYQDSFDTLLGNGVFGMANGSATIHFDKDGKVSLIDVHTYIRL